MHQSKSATIILRSILKTLLVFASGLSYAEDSAAEIGTERLAVAVSNLPERISTDAPRRDLLTTILLRNIAPGLGRLHGEKEIRPLLAKSISSEKAGTKFVFTLSPTGQGLDGRILNAKALVDYFRAKQQLPANLSPSIKVEPINSHNLEDSAEGFSVELDPTDSNQFRKFASLVEAPILDTQLSGIFKDRIGTSTLLPGYGQYELLSFGPTKAEIISRKGGPRTPAFAKVEFIEITDLQEQIKLLRTGSVDMLLLPTKSQIEQASKDPTLHVVTLDPKAFIDPSDIQPSASETKSIEIASKKKKPQDETPVLVELTVILRNGIELSQSFDGSFTTSQITRKY